MTDIHHIGVRVADIEKTASILTRAFGVEIRYDTTARSPRLRRIAYAMFGNCRLELIEDPEDPPAGNEQAVLDHIAIGTSDIVPAMRDLASAGFESLDDHPRVAAFGNQVAAYDRDTFSGIKLHLVRERERKEP